MPTRRVNAKERTEQHVRGHLEDHTINMQSELRGRAKTRRHGKSCDTESRATPKTRKHRNPCDTEIRVNRRKHGKPCEPTKTRKPVWRLKDAEIPNSRNPTTCSKRSGIRPELRTSRSLNIRKDGEDQKPMQNRILEQKSSVRRRTSGSTRRVRNDDSNADKAWSRKGSNPRAQRPQVELEGEC
jgi:hypothetical protein